MAVDMFLKISDIKGESTDAKHPGEIEIESFSFGQAADTTDAGRVGKASMQDFHFVMHMNKATPPLMQKAAKGDKVVSGLDYALLTVRKVGATQAEFLKIKFYDALISSFQNGTAAADLLPDRPVQPVVREDRAQLQRAETGRVARGADLLQMGPDQGRDVLGA